MSGSAGPYQRSDLARSLAAAHRPSYASADFPTALATVPPDGPAQAILNAIPMDLKRAIGIGIGLSSR